MDAAEVVIASNRGPIGFRRGADGTVTAARGGGGLVSAMSGLADDASTLWVCAALSELDREVSSAAPGGRLDLAGHAEGGAVQMLPIDADTLDAAYNTVANTTLWYLHHGMIDYSDPPTYDVEWRRAWASYVDYNEAFARAIATAAAPSARVLVQDYHLALLPAMLRARRPDLRISHFTHTPWAEPRALALLPADVARDLLIGMLGADSIGFHSTRWAREFIDCAADQLDAEDLDTAVRYDDRVSAVRVHPLGVDAGPLLARASQPDVDRHRAELRARLDGRQSVVRVDRTEPSKNLVGGLRAFRELLVRYPEHRDRVVHVALAYPSRQDVEDYRRYTALVESLAEQINAELATPTWRPVLLAVRDDYAESLATLQLGTVQLINPLRDGMNLVAKEAALLSNDGVLVLSEQAGAADEMAPYALMVDPLDTSGTADALHTALTMSSEERSARHAGLARVATALPPREWLRQQLDALD